MECKFRGGGTTWMKDYSRVFGVGNFPSTGSQVLYRDFDVQHSFGLLGLHHLGFGKLDSPEFVLNRGFDVVVDYFCGTWWRNDRDSVQALDKSRKRARLYWADCFSQGIMLGLLSERWKEVAKVCGWVEANLKHEYPRDYEDELISVYKSIAAGLRKEPMTGLDRIEKQIMKCRVDRPKLVFQAWNAARTGNQAGFEEWLVKSLEHFVANIPPNPIPLDAVALHSSVVCAAGRRLGMKLPALPPKLEAVLMTRESLGLPSLAK